MGLSGGDVDGKPVWAHWVWCKYGVDFIKQDGEWRIWHFRCYEVARAPFNRDWISFAKDNQESHDSQLAWFGDDGVPVFLPPVDGRARRRTTALRERHGAAAEPGAAEAVRPVRGHLRLTGGSGRGCALLGREGTYPRPSVGQRGEQFRLDCRTT